MSEQITTPQPFRSPEPLSNFPRYNFESEVWDSLANNIYHVAATSLPFTMPVAGRVEIHGSAEIDAAGTLTLNIDGTSLFPASVGAPGATVIVFAAPDIPAGPHTLTLTSTALISSPNLLLRRGRKGD